MSNEHNCPRCNAPFLYFTGVNTRVFYCGSDTQIPSVACRYASQLQERIKMLEVVERLSTAQMDYIQQLETENDAMRADLLLYWEDKWRE
jgi:hypothetical protein